MLVGEASRAASRPRAGGSTPRTRCTSFYRWIVALRREATWPTPTPRRRPSRVETLPDARPGGAFFDLLVLSNRLPELRSAERHRRRASATSAASSRRSAPALARRRDLARLERPHAPGGDRHRGRPRPGRTGSSLAWVDFPEEWHRHYYNGLCNSALWPLFHSFPSRLKIVARGLARYERRTRRSRRRDQARRSRARRSGRTTITCSCSASTSARAGTRGRSASSSTSRSRGRTSSSSCRGRRSSSRRCSSSTSSGFHTRGLRRRTSSVHGARCPACAIEGATRPPRQSERHRAAPSRSASSRSEFQERADAAASDEIAGPDARHRSGAPGAGRRPARLHEGDPGAHRRVRPLARASSPSGGGRRASSRSPCPRARDVPEYAEQRSRVENIVGRDQRRVRRGRLGADPLPVPLLRGPSSRSSIAPPTSVT